MPDDELTQSKPNERSETSRIISDPEKLLELVLSIKHPPGPKPRFFDKRHEQLRLAQRRHYWRKKLGLLPAKKRREEAKKGEG